MNEIYGSFREEMVAAYFGAIGGDSGVLDVKCGLMVPDGLWYVTAKMDVDNNESFKKPLLEFRLSAGNSHDRRVVRFGVNGDGDRANLSFMLLAHFPGDQSGRVNNIGLGYFNHHDSTSDTPKIKMGRMKIIAVRVPHWEMNAYPAE